MTPDGTAGASLCVSAARTPGPDLAGLSLTGWWPYVPDDVIGAALAVLLIGLVRGLPDRAETEAAEGSALAG